MRRIVSVSSLLLIAPYGVALLSASGCVPEPTESGTDTASAGATDSGETDTAGQPTTGELLPAATCTMMRTQAQEVLGEYCGACHGVDGKGELSNITDLEGLVESGRVKARDSANSLIYQRIDKDEMPPQPPKVPADELAILAQWIDECSVSPGEEIADPRKPPECLPDEQVTTEEWIDLIHADLATISFEDLPFQRYISFIDVYNAGYCAAQLNTYHQALIKLMNSLSRATALALPTVVDGSHGAIFRIDLRDWDWTADLWDQVACANPYSVDYGVNVLLSNARAIQLDTQTALFVQPGRAFMHFAARAPLYHDILEIPETLAQLAAIKSGIPDLAANVLAEQTGQKKGAVERAGFYESGVSFSNRMIERHDVPADKTGYFWSSHDFANNKGLSDIFTHPLDFVAGGGEIIFSLPNGMQGYMIVNESANRVDEAPQKIVADPDSEDNVVRTAISCIGCHAAGIIPKADDLRAYAEANPDNSLTPDVIFGVRKLHPEENVLGIQTEDSNRFMGALNALGVPHVIEAADGQIEPIRISDFAFELNVDQLHAASELGTSPAKVNSIIILVPKLGLLFDKPGELSRKDFEEVFPAAIEALQIGDAKPIAACTPG